MAATHTHTLTAGDQITGRPWVNGYETATRKGYVVSTEDRHVQDGYVLVWFYGMGNFSRDEAGKAVQPIMVSKLAVVGHIASMPAPRLSRLARKLNRSQQSELAPLYQVLLRLPGVR